MTRAIAVPKLAAHLDLLHPARALWKLRLGSVRLIELERHVLNPAGVGWRRDEDIPSSLIPEYFFNYLRGGPAEPLVRVARHNQMDLRGLAALFGRINALLAEREGAPGEIESLDLFGLSRFLQRRGQSERAQIACAQALDLGLPAEFRPQASRELALLAKRQGDHQQAAAIWHELTADLQEAVDACEQLAIHYERREKNLSRAAEFAALAMAKLRLSRSRSRDRYAAARTQRLEKRLLHRVARLQERLRLSRVATNTPLLMPLEHASSSASKRGAAHSY
ncbi:MAG: ribonuclease H-like domain-containing protein, partial [Candidatus Acidiferrum sp.]